MKLESRYQDLKGHIRGSLKPDREFGNGQESIIQGLKNKSPNQKKYLCHILPPMKPGLKESATCGTSGT